MLNTEKLPRVLKEPTGWVIIVLVIGFFYMQWPTRVRTVEEPIAYKQTLANGFSVIWESEPALQQEGELTVWGFSRKAMSFLVQTGKLTGSFETMVTTVSEQDRKTVAGAVQEPLSFGDNQATYAYFDAESRIQEHKWFVIGEQWVKVSVLYKPSMESRVIRAQAFMNSIQIP
jgi:hypothetical protein